MIKFTNVVVLSVLGNCRSIAFLMDRQSKIIAKEYEEEFELLTNNNDYLLKDRQADRKTNMQD